MPITRFGSYQMMNRNKHTASINNRIPLFKIDTTMMMKGTIYFAVLIFFLNIQITSSNESEPDYYRYLQQFGYTPKVEGRRLFSSMSKSTYSDGIKTFQRLYKLPVTGELDTKTKKFMQRPRCGNPDLGTVNSITRPVNVDRPESLGQNLGRSAKNKAPEKYVAQSNSWPKKNLKWFIEQYPQAQQLIKDKDQINRIFRQAFNDWEKYSGLTFEMVKDKKFADLKIKFNSKEHGDGYPFDGQGATLAHAFYPQAGDIHFDDDERFTDKYKNEEDHYTLRLVAAHEIGHALGLAHSYEEDSLMFPVYQQFKADYNISTDDQAGIQSLYGKPEEKAKVESTTASPAGTGHSTDSIPLNNWCSEEFDTGCEGPDGELYLFKNDQVWRYRAKTKRSWDPEPTLISERFPSLTDMTITACVKSTTGYVHLFRNYRMWKLRTHWSGNGPDILNGKNYPQNPRAALRHQNAIYLIREHLVYRLNEFDHDKELEITTLDSIFRPPPKERIRAGFTYDKRHYIFTAKHVYVYDSTKGNLLPGYPKPANNGWFACEKASQASGLNKNQRTGGHRQKSGRENHQHRRPPHHRQYEGK